MDRESDSERDRERGRDSETQRESESERETGRERDFAERLLLCGGLDACLRVLLSLPARNDTLSLACVRVVLYVTHTLLDASLSISAAGSAQPDMSGSVVSMQPDVFDLLSTDESSVLFEKLLFFASLCAARGEANVVRGALVLAMRLMRAPAVAERFVSVSPSHTERETEGERDREQSLSLKTFLVNALQSESREIRESANHFAVELGRRERERQRESGTERERESAVLCWLVEHVERLPCSDSRCGETFSALLTLLQSEKERKEEKNEVVARLARSASNKLLSLRDDPLTCKLSNGSSSSVTEESAALLGWLDVLEALLEIAPLAVRGTALGERDETLVSFVTDELLFATHTHALCESVETRRAAFRVLLASSRSSRSVYSCVLSRLESLSLSAAARLSLSWSKGVAQDVRRRDTRYAGLKNQGCTCYMNSLLQCLFMDDAFRESVLSAPIPIGLRTTLWHVHPVALVGKEVLFEWHSSTAPNGSIWRCGTVVGYDEVSRTHRVQYRSHNALSPSHSALEELAVLDIHEGRPQRETGRVRLAPTATQPALTTHDNAAERGGENSANAQSAKPLSEEDIAAYAVLEQLQRTFCHLHLSKKRFFDPRMLVDACKALNLSYSVYQQNDAAEFCDKLLDRIEIATKNTLLRSSHTQRQTQALSLSQTHSERECESVSERKSCGNLPENSPETAAAESVWQGVFLKRVFGGQWITQKIPRDCVPYAKDKESCGHWQGARREAFLKVELMIRGKRDIHESLRELVQGELMDGENKIHCDVCDEKKATVRRSTLLSLPNTLVLHLKRFDLDFSTFETVKLNSRMEFPLRINMLQYTREGVEAAEKLQECSSSNVNGECERETERAREPLSLRYESESGAALDPAQYEYELQGVLVHAGVAQGGHYYSFVRETLSQRDTQGEREGEWFRFDDDEVAPFTADQIPSQCYGGSSSHCEDALYSTQAVEDDRTSNALVLFYNKVSVPPSPSVPLCATEKVPAPPITRQDLPSPPSSGPAPFTRQDLPPPPPPVPTPAPPLTRQGIDESQYYEMVDGYTAFSREVHEANVEHLQSVYVVDPELHSFVRSFLSLLTERETEREGEMGPQPLSNTLQWRDSGDTTEDLALRSVQFAARFLLDVTLHCRERPGARQSALSLRDAFSQFPRSAEWFLGEVVLSHTSQHTHTTHTAHTARAHNTAWFQELLQHCPDPLARATFAQVLSSAVAAVIQPTQPTDNASLTHTDTFSAFQGVSLSQLRDRALHSNPEKIALLLRILLDSVVKATNHVRVADELFSLVRDLAAIPTAAALMRELNFVGFLSFFVMPDGVSDVLLNLFEKNFVCKSNNVNSNNNSVCRVDYSALHQSVFEAIAALLGAPQSHKLPLLTEHSFYEKELTQEARDALTVVFEESASSHGAMDGVALHAFLNKTLLGVKPSNAMVRHIQEHFGSGNDGRLNLTGFLNYQTDLAAYNPKQVWRCLNVFGFRNDLSRKTRPGPAASLAPFSSSYHAEADETAWSVVPLASLVEHSRRCLLELQFYEVGIAAAEASARAILQAVCRELPTESLSLVQQALTKLFNVVADNAWHNQAINVLTDFFKLLLSVDDAHRAQRMEFILLCNRIGLCKVILGEQQKPSKVRANEYSPTEVLKRYVAVVEDLISSPGALQCLHELAATKPEVRAVRGVLHLTPGSKLTFDQEAQVQETVVVVEDAGCEEVNGRYEFKSLKNHAGYYVKNGSYRGNNACFTLYKCSMKNGGFQWFISITPLGLDPGTVNDIDFYYVPGKESEFLPPTRWRTCASKETQDPAPFVRLEGPPSSSSAAAESEWAVVDDGDLMDYEEDSDSDDVPRDANMSYNADESFTSLYSDNE